MIVDRPRQWSVENGIVNKKLFTSPPFFRFTPWYRQISLSSDQFVFLVDRIGQVESGVKFARLGRCFPTLFSHGSVLRRDLGGAPPPRKIARRSGGVWGVWGAACKVWAPLGLQELSTDRLRCKKIPRKKSANKHREALL